MLVTAQKFQSQYELVNKPSARWSQRTTLPQSALSGRQLPQRGSRDAGCTVQRAARKPQRCGRFSSPLRNSDDFGFYHSSKYTPSVSHSLSSSLREGAGNELYHSMCRPKTATLRAIFIAPTKAQKFLHFTIHRGTLPQSALRAASSLREGAGMRAVPFNVPPGNHNVAGDFHRPYEAQKFLHYTIHQTLKHNFFQNGRRNSYESC